MSMIPDLRRGLGSFHGAMVHQTTLGSKSTDLVAAGLISRQLADLFAFILLPNSIPLSDSGVIAPHSQLPLIADPGILNKPNRVAA